MASAILLAWLLLLAARVLARAQVSKNDAFCIKNEELCIQNDEFCRWRGGSCGLARRWGRTCWPCYRPWASSSTAVSFQWKNLDFRMKNPDFLLKNVDFLLKNVDFYNKTEPLLAADRYSYLPALLLGTPLLASALHHAVSEWRMPRSAVFGTAVAVLGIFCAVSRDYSAAYSTRESLWRRAVSLDPADSGTVNQLALAVQKAGRHAEALPLFDRATELRPDFADAWSNAGRSLLEMERPDEALSRWSTAIAIREDHRDAWLNRGVSMER